MSLITDCNVTIMVSSMDKAVAFYTETLGFTLKNRYGDHWADVSAPGLSIGLHPASERVTKGNNLSLGLKVANVEKAMKELQERDVRFHVHDDGQVLLAFFEDPDGNSMYLVETQ